MTTYMYISGIVIGFVHGVFVGLWIARGPRSPRVIEQSSLDAQQ